jgi:hypothetical protein|mmetsp:Transcript_72657/g.122307  ORF Transcript_72657/g.122307 Transcript_72657/m.122307 type:complete len:88 (-) Transcript_72657:1108-1371(-)
MWKALGEPQVYCYYLSLKRRGTFLFMVRDAGQMYGVQNKGKARGKKIDNGSAGNRFLQAIACPMESKKMVHCNITSGDKWETRQHRK